MISLNIGVSPENKIYKVRMDTIQQHFEILPSTLAKGTTTCSLFGLTLGGVKSVTVQWYRSTSSNFTPGAGNILSGKTSPSLSDTGLSRGTTYYYKMVSTDIIGNTVTSPQLTVVVNRSVVTDGNSLTFGTLASVPAFTYPVRLLWNWPIVNPDIAMTNIAVAGQTTPQMIADMATQLPPLVVGGITNILVAWEMTNDIFFNGVTGATAYNNMATYCSTAQGYGYKVIVVTGTPRVTFDATMEAARISANSLVRANYNTFADGLVDIGLDQYIGLPGSYSNTTYYNADGIHFTDFGYWYVSQLIEPVIAAIS